jgi:hypothetical protein
LRAILDPSYSCGLEKSDEAFSEIEGWSAHAHQLASNVARMRPATLSVGVHAESGLPSLIDLTRPGLLSLVVHPLWRTDGSHGIALGADGATQFLNTFELERRPLRALAELTIP